MNDTEKKAIIDLRNQGLGYMKISQALGVPMSTVKSFCRRHGVSKDAKADELLEKHCCLQCGKPVKQNKGRKEKRFCSDKCRMAWWNSHRALVKHKKVHDQVCPLCHKIFKVYGKRERKFCSHECYVKYRFGGDQDA